MTKDEAVIVLNLTCEQWGMPIPRFRLTRVRGRATLNTKHISIPKWALREYGEAYAIYYICHELAHLKLNRAGHDTDFKQVEATLLESWGITAGHYEGKYPEKKAVGYGPRAF